MLVLVVGFGIVQFAMGSIQSWSSP